MPFDLELIAVIAGFLVMTFALSYALLVAALWLLGKLRPATADPWRKLLIRSLKMAGICTAVVVASILIVGLAFIESQLPR